MAAEQSKGLLDDIRKGWTLSLLKWVIPSCIYTCVIFSFSITTLFQLLCKVFSQRKLCVFGIWSRAQRRNAYMYVCVWVCVCEMSCLCVCSRYLQLFGTLWTVTHQAPLSIGFSRQEYWSGLLFPPPGDLPNSEIKLESPMSPALQADSLTAEPSGKPVKCHGKHQLFYIFTYFYFFVCTVLVYGATF